jgi:pyruvate dehydrogenase E1 component alpha subunit
MIYTTNITEYLFVISRYGKITKATILSKKYATAAQIEAIDDKIKLIVEESVQFSENSPLPSDEELYKDIYVQQDYPFMTEPF